MHKRKVIGSRVNPPLAAGAESRRSGTTPFELTVVAPAGSRDVLYLKTHLRSAHRMLRSPLRHLSLILTDDETMSDLHQRFMKQPGPTDVLTFPIDVDARGRPVGGEVYICVPEARRRAREYGVCVRDELLLYALHGMLHLSEFDDRTKREFQHMHRTEDRILSRLGVGPVFQPAPSRARARKNSAAARKTKPAGARR